MVSNDMPKDRRKVFLAILSVGLGIVLGYLLFNPLISLPAEWVVHALKPPLLFASQQIDNDRLEHIFVLVSIQAVMDLPNTMLVGLVAALSLSWLQRRRPILYATLLWPLALYGTYWIEAALLKHEAARLGLPLSRLPLSPDFPYTAGLVVVTVTVFLLATVLLDRLFQRASVNLAGNLRRTAE